MAAIPARAELRAPQARELLGRRYRRGPAGRDIDRGDTDWCIRHGRRYRGSCSGGHQCRDRSVPGGALQELHTRSHAGIPGARGRVLALGASPPSRRLLLGCDVDQAVLSHAVTPRLKDARRPRSSQWPFVQLIRPNRQEAEEP